jgi:hypothetical protein
MNTLKIVGLLAAGVGIAAVIGGGVWYWRKRKLEGPRPEKPQRVDPGKPPRRDSDDSTPEEKAEATRPRGHMVNKDDLDPELAKELNNMFEDGWPPDDQTINDLEQDDVIVFAAESEETGNYTELRQELISAKVLSVESSHVRARVMGPVEHAEHHGSHAGHGFRVGDLVEVPRSQVLVAARRTDTDKDGYGSLGDPAATLKPSNETKKVYTVNPGTPYDLVLPYRTEHLVWWIDKDNVTVEHVGEDGLLEQVLFSEDSLRGDVSVRAVDKDPEVGAVFVARWDFELDA